MSSLNFTKHQLEWLEEHDRWIEERTKKNMEQSLDQQRKELIEEIKKAQQRATKLNDKVSAEYVGLFLQTLIEKLTKKP